MCSAAPRDVRQRRRRRGSDDREGAREPLRRRGDRLDDLEDALAVEAARSGRATGEATAVLRTLPEDARRRVPLRLRHADPRRCWPGRIAVAAGRSSSCSRRRPRGEGHGAAGTSRRRPAPSRCRSSAPRPTTTTRRRATARSTATASRSRVDRDPGTAWSTETYQDQQLAGKPGVGLYIDAAPQVAASSMLIRTRDRVGRQRSTPTTDAA